MKKLKLNSISAVIYQVLLIVSGLILPRCYLIFYGSEVNGLLSSITQFLSFINICDMGISAVISSALYKPLAENNNERISKVFVYSQRFFRKISYILLVYVGVLIITYPYMVIKKFDFMFTAVLIVCMSISNFSQYFLGISYQLLLNADQRSYIQLIINAITLIANTAISVLIMTLGGNIHLVKLIASLIYVLRPVLMALYVKKNYKIDYTVATDSSVVTQKKNGIIQHISYMVCENTDIAVLTVFSTLSNVSVYSIYYLVLNSIKSLINAGTTGIQAMFGNLIARNETEKLKQLYDVFEWSIHTIVMLLFTITLKMIVPFVLIYTKGTTDAQYDVRLFAALMTVAFGISSIRNAMYILIRSAGHYKQTQTASMAEAIINLAVSVVLVHNWGLVGVAIGTLLSAVFYSTYLMFYLEKEILHRKKLKTLRQFTVDILSVIIMIITTIPITVNNNTFVGWIFGAILTSIICVLDTIIIQAVFYNNMLRKAVMTFCNGLHKTKTI